MKKTLYLLVALLVVLSLTACGKQDDTVDPSQNDTVVTDGTDDGSDAVTDDTVADDTVADDAQAGDTVPDDAVDTTPDDDQGADDAVDTTPDDDQGADDAVDPADTVPADDNAEGGLVVGEYDEDTVQTIDFSELFG